MAKTSSKPAPRSNGSALGFERAAAFHPGLSRAHTGGCILANASMSSNQSGEGDAIADL
jgi:hypothetical protein